MSKNDAKCKLHHCKLHHGQYIKREEDIMTKQFLLINLPQKVRMLYILVIYETTQ